MNYAFTGGTGFLGRNLFLEIIKQNINNLEGIRMILFGRSTDKQTLKQRMETILFETDKEYLPTNFQNSQALKSFFEHQILFVETDLSKNELGISKENINQLLKEKIDVFYHVASLSSFRNSPSIIRKLTKVNIEGTRQVLDLVERLNVKEFGYVGSAYSCGKNDGEIAPDFVNTGQGFRNFYEESKQQAELLVRDFNKKTGVKCRYFRPSIICGRLMENRIGAIPKFDVFYGWGGFFCRVKMKMVSQLNQIYAQDIQLNLRILYTLKAGINIVPVDYVAKAMYQICTMNVPEDSFHLVNEELTPHELHLNEMMRLQGISGHTHVTEMPTDLNDLEKMYYNHVGKIFNNYLENTAMYFNTDNLKPLKDVGLNCPKVEYANFGKLMEYAKDEYFGISALKDAMKNDIVLV